jgi:putative salt-induced outer membrane protein YdiY
MYVCSPAVASLFILACLLGAGTALAQEGDEPWQPQAPEGMPSDFDWIRLPSDEWLKGEIVSMYDGTLEFDSDELDDLSFDFADIKEIRTSRVVQIGFEKRDPAIGTMYMDGETVTITGDAGEVQFHRSEILTIIVGTPKEINYWSGYANIGGNIRSGNTDQLDYTGRLGAMRRSLRSRMRFDYIGNITRVDVKVEDPPGTTKTEETSNNHLATLGWDWFLTKRLFVNVIGAEWYRDPFVNIANRWTLTAGVGYQIIDTSRTSWDATLGPAWLSTEFESVEPDQDDTTDSGALRLGTSFDHEIKGDIDFYALYNAMFTDKENGTYLHHFDTGLDFELVGNLDFNISWVWDRVQDPRDIVLEDGTVQETEQDDFRIIFGLGWDF